MLQKVRLLNYRGLKDTTISLAPITLLTGTNGVGKTSVLEGLYFLLTHQIPDASVFPRYQQSMIHNIRNMAVYNGVPNMQILKGYDYPSFWRECSANGAINCKVEAVWEMIKLSWEMKISDFAELEQEIKNIASAYGLQSGVDIPYVLWDWSCIGKKRKDNNSYEMIDVHHSSKAVQQLSIEPRFSPRIGGAAFTTCRYIDMSSARYILDKLPWQSETLLTEALRIINPNVTGVRYGGNVEQLRVIINNNSEYSLGSLGVGAETWTTVLLVLAELASINNPELSLFLVDEIGAGIHYSKLEEIWDFLLKFSLKYPQVQMVLKAHSKDCINAFCRTFQNANPNMAHIVQMYKSDEKDEVRTTVFPQEIFETILSGEWEVR
jgi:ABC-type branched-subunit amino acid transport system ATPase component